MSSVKRYEVNGSSSFYEDEKGSFVDYEDYVALEAKCAALAAENAGLKSLIEQHADSVAVCPNCSHEEPSETDDIVALYRSMETPATEAYRDELRAQGIEMAAKSDQFSMWVQQGLRSFAIGVLQGGAE